jgi:hypothetical protein
MDGFHDNKWFVYINDHHEGPFSMAQLQSKLQTGEVNRTQYVWAEGMPDWQLITTVRELDPVLTLTAAPIFAPPPSAAFEHEPSIDLPLEGPAHAPDDFAPEPVFRPALAAQPEARAQVGSPANPVILQPVKQPLAQPVAQSVDQPVVPQAPQPAPQPAAPVQPQTLVEQPVLQPISVAAPAPKPAPASQPAAVTLQPTQPAAVTLQPTQPARETPAVQVPPALEELHDERFDSEPSLDPVGTLPRNDNSPQMMFASVSIERPRSGGFLKIFLFLAILGAIAFGYVIGALDPIIKNPRVVSTAVFIGDLTSPATTRVAQWVPQLQRWFSPIPYMPGIDNAEFAALRSNALRSDAPRLTLALDRSDSTAPSFHVSSALPNGTKLDLVLIGTPELLLSQTSLELKATTEVIHRLATFEGLRQVDGRPIAQGEYRVFVMESEAGSQPPAVEAFLAELPDSQEAIPSDLGISAKHKLFVQKTYFLAGEKDDTYSKRLKDFHERLRTRSSEELKELAGVVQTLMLQLTGTIEEHSKIATGKPAKGAEKRWNEFHEKWTGQQTRLDTNFAGWAEALTRKEFFHWGLYQMVKQLSEKVSQLHVQQHSGVLIRPTDEKEFQAQLTEKQKAAREALTELDRKLTESRKLNEGVEGMPKRLKFEEEPALAPAEAAAEPVAAEAAPALEPAAAEAAPAPEPAAAEAAPAPEPAAAGEPAMQPATTPGGKAH